MSFWQPQGKETVESYSSISIFELHKRHASDERHISLGHGSFTLGNTRLRFAQDSDGYYLELLDLPPGTNVTAINLVTSPCNYGGHREWFECGGCQGRVGILYHTKDWEFRCRHCLNLNYSSQKRNYRGMVPAFVRFMKAHDMEPVLTHQFHNGKITKRAARFWRRQEEAKRSMEAYSEFLER